MGALSQLAPLHSGLLPPASCPCAIPPSQLARSHACLTEIPRSRGSVRCYSILAFDFQKLPQSILDAAAALSYRSAPDVDGAAAPQGKPLSRVEQQVLKVCLLDTHTTCILSRISAGSDAAINASSSFCYVFLASYRRLSFRPRPPPAQCREIQVENVDTAQRVLKLAASET